MALLVLASGGARADRDVPAGFRGEGDPKIETVFGDVRQYRGSVDRFFAVHADMGRARVDFHRSVQAALLALGAERGRCPVDSLAAPYARAARAGQTFHRLGKDLEALDASIRELDRLGETAGLTPDYRWKVARALKLYPATLKDFREMKASFQTELQAEVKFRGCDPAALVARGDEMERAAPAVSAPRAVAAAPPAPPAPRPAAPPAPAAPVAAAASTTATFFVDNTSCGESLRVYIDAILLGEVAHAGKGAFQTLAGRHELCLIPADRADACGAPGTVRQTYIHDGWSIALRCD